MIPDIRAYRLDEAVEIMKRSGICVRSIRIAAPPGQKIVAPPGQRIAAPLEQMPADGFGGSRVLKIEVLEDNIVELVVCKPL